MRAALVFPFLRPEAYYRLEIGAGEPDQHGRRRLDKLAIVTAIQQTLFGDKRPPRLQAALFLGRNETLRDAATLRQGHAAYVDSQGSMKTLVGSLLSLDSFLYRSTEP